MAGELNTRDLDILFLWLRGHSFGLRTVADVGNFVAHSDERERGMAWNGVQHFFNVARFLLPRAGHAEVPPIGTIEDLKMAARSAFALSTADEVRSATGLSVNRAGKLLEAALDALASLKGRELALTRPLSSQESAVLKSYTTVLISRPAFTSDDLISELLTCLAKNHLIDHVPGRLPRPFSDFAALYAVERMHRVQITLKDGSQARLRAGILTDTGNEYLGVTATAPMNQGDFSIEISFPIYMTNLDPWEWCTPELLPSHHFSGTDWDFGLEIGASGELQML